MLAVVQRVNICESFVVDPARWTLAEALFVPDGSKWTRASTEISVPAQGSLNSSYATWLPVHPCDWAWFAVPNVLPVLLRAKLHSREYVFARSTV